MSTSQLLPKANPTIGEADLKIFSREKRTSRKMQLQLTPRHHLLASFTTRERKKG